MATAIDTYNKILDEFGFDPTDDKGFRSAKSERFEGCTCHADFLNGKMRIQGNGPTCDYNSGYIRGSELQIRALLTLFVENYV